MPPKIDTSNRNVMETYQAAVQANPHSAQAHCNLGWGHYGQKQMAEAVKAFQEAIRLDQTTVDAFYGLGLAYKAQGAKVEAVQAFTEAQTHLAQMPDQIRAHMLGRLIQAQILETQTGAWSR